MEKLNSIVLLVLDVFPIISRFLVYISLQLSPRIPLVKGWEARDIFRYKCQFACMVIHTFSGRAQIQGLLGRLERRIQAVKMPLILNQKPWDSWSIHVFISIEHGADLLEGSLAG